MAKKEVFIIAVLAVVALLIGGGFGTFMRDKKGFNDKVRDGISSQKEEKALIDAWILENNLNQYGDPKDTIYLGGTPLFDERTGQTIDKYEYILKNHPDKPWNKIKVEL